MSKRASAPRAVLEASRAPFPYRDYVHAQQALLAALKGPPFYALLLGASGMGKSALLRGVVEGMDRHHHQAIYLSSTRASMSNIVRFLARVLRVPSRRSSLETVDELAKAIRAQPAKPVVLVDEADRLAPETLQEFRVIAECELQEEPLFSVVLSGLPSLGDLIESPVAFPLKRRLSLRCSLAGLLRDELGPFLEHRFGPDARRVPPSTLDELFERTQAAPGLLDAVVRRALLSPGRLEPDAVHAVLDQSGL
ncbi:MAG: AAA family ATPase [Burkholderiales bacterium]